MPRTPEENSCLKYNIRVDGRITAAVRLRPLATDIVENLKLQYPDSKITVTDRAGKPVILFRNVLPHPDTRLNY